ncbi:succinyldiaminopimelate transaminase [Haematomicrobium sanguinis]|uniref:succinyldiaminopimelate transaminase n=1 Tax=Haematomicrobium sanguinis TaxID=479106 RepID=UPI0004795D35|nr:succinyldiaminopimelate transaminase [Haematomicrobium sanguinis]
MPKFGLDLPDYPWESLAPYREIAATHPQGVIDLSIGTPIDPTPEVIQDALRHASDAPGYPTTHGSRELREAIAQWFSRRRQSPEVNPDGVLPTVGSKEAVAWLPALLGLGNGDIVVYPRVAYPTYDMGARLAGAEGIAADSLEELSAEQRGRVKLVWINSPGNPTGNVLDKDALAKIVEQTRQVGAVLASDECYAELGWGRWDVQLGGEPVPSLLNPEVNGGSLDGLIALYSLSKQSNLAGYRAAFMAGDPSLIEPVLTARKHAGMIVPAPVQNAMIAALGDEAHVVEQKGRYRARREVLRPALTALGLTIEESHAGLYLWGSFTGGDAEPTAQDTWDAVERFARMGIVVGPGVFYGKDGDGFVRVALTASDEDIEAAAARMHLAEDTRS